MRILFMGTPEFAVASLKALVEAGHEICGVFTQPDKPKNRGHKLTFSPVKEYALSQNLPVYQPLKLRDGTALALVQELHPELIVVAAYGRILPEDILNMPPYGSINVHSSILPKYRGSAPINWAVLNGEKVTGVTIMYMAAELDAGDIIRVAETPIDPDEDAQTLTARLALLGADALVQTVHDLTAGTATREELSRNSGKPNYVLEFYTDRCAYSYKVDAVSGDILEKNIEWRSRQESEPVSETVQSSDSNQRRIG